MKSAGPRPDGRSPRVRPCDLGLAKPLSAVFGHAIDAALMAVGLGFGRLDGAFWASRLPSPGGVLDI
jgi:hypothetical protein